MKWRIVLVWFLKKSVGRNLLPVVRGGIFSAACAFVPEYFRRCLLVIMADTIRHP